MIVFKVSVYTSKERVQYNQLATCWHDCWCRAIDLFGVSAIVVIGPAS